MPVSRMVSVRSFLVGSKRDFERPVVAVLLFGQLDVPHLVQRVGRVRDQFPQRDLAALIERVRQQMQELLDFGLKREFLFFGGIGHVVFPCQNDSTARRAGPE